jgi:photosystem II stability/assembly factor-like uncharacterized protein
MAARAFASRDSSFAEVAKMAAKPMILNAFGATLLFLCIPAAVLSGIAILGALVIAPSTALGGWMEQISNSQRSLMVVHAVSSDVAWAVGDAGEVVVTVDGGLNWVRRPIVGAEHLVGLFAFDGESSVVADWTGNFWRTTNGGQDWLQVHSAGSFIDGIHFFDTDSGWALGDPVEDAFVLLETTNGGLTWTASNGPPANPGTAGILGAYDWVGTELAIFGVSSGGVIWRTTNGGAHWNSIAIDPWFLSGVELSNAGVGLASGVPLAGGPRLLVRSTDFGQTWETGQHPPNSQPMRDFDWIESSSEVWGVTAQTGLYQSTNEGQDWIQHILAAPGEWIANDIDFIDASTGWCVGTRSPGFGPGRIFKYSNTVDVAVASAVPTQAMIRIHPNPFATDVTLELDPIRGVLDEVAIYDVMGRKLKVLLPLTLGTGQYHWDGRDQYGREVADGFYLYRVRRAATETTGSLIKLR